MHDLLTEIAATQEIGEHGLVALDWMGGNRSVLVDHTLTGVIVGQSLSTTAPEVYRALFEATAFGTRTIIEAFEAAGVPVHELVVAGGLLRNALLMQIYADITRRPLSLIDSDQGPALGAAIFAAVAAGAYPDVYAASEAMGKVLPRVYTPNDAAADAYDALVRGVPHPARLLRPGRQRRAPPALCHQPRGAYAEGGCRAGRRLSRHGLTALHPPP